ncbi:DAK2 domain-containing protein [Halanaerocella petrolearia]
MLTNQLKQEVEEIDAVQFKEMLAIATDTLDEAKDEINNLNIFPVPDGDTGSNMYATISRALEEVKEAPEGSVASVVDKLAVGALMGARGNSGVILSQLFKGLADGIGKVEVLTADNLADGLQEAANVAYQAVMKPVEGTILTVAKDVGNKAQELKGQVDIIELLVAVIKEAKVSVARTPQLLDELEEAGVVDAGGRGYQLFLEGLLAGLTREEIEVKDNNLAKEIHQQVTETEENYGYCTEFIIQDPTVKIDKFRNEIANKGNSLLVAQAEEILKVHIHTDHPGRILETGLRYGRLTDIKIDNMSQQHQERIKDTIKDDKIEVDRLAVLTVVAGEGLREVFNNLGVDYILEGGQSMNPSTQDLLIGVEEIDSNQIVILPNNKNVISTAKQVEKLTDKRIKVIPTCNIPQGVAAMMSFDSTGELDQISEAMEEELDFVTAGAVTYAVRDTKFDQWEIQKDDILGLVEGDIKVVADDYNQVAIELIEQMISEEDSLLTIYVGQNISQDKQEDLIVALEERYYELDIEVYKGQQPIYYYIISLE